MSAADPHQHSGHQEPATGRKGGSSGAKPPPARAARKLWISGAVQGVGFRPFIHRLALDLYLTGEVRNTTHGVEIHVEGPLDALDKFALEIDREPPPLARVDSVRWMEVAFQGWNCFTISHSSRSTEVTTVIAPDAATYPDCLQELLDPHDRRYR